MTDLDGVGDFWGPYDINDRGQIVSGYGFVWHDGARTDLGTVGGSLSFAQAINENGQVAGHSQHAFLWQDGVMTDLGTLGGDVSDAVDVNDEGQVVGNSFTVPGLNGHIPQHAFIWQNGVMTDLGALGGTFSRAAAINDKGPVVDDTSIASGNQAREHAFLWEDGTIRLALFETTIGWQHGLIDILVAGAAPMLFSLGAFSRRNGPARG